MAVHVLFHAGPGRWEEYREPLAAAAREAGLDLDIGPDLDPARARYIVYAPWSADTPRLDLASLPELRAVLSLWAGIESIVDEVPRTVPLTRMVDDGLTRGMVEYVAGHVLRHHLGMDAHIVNPGHAWDQAAPPLAADRRVTILGLGALGRAATEALVMLGFPVTGWSRSPKQVAGVRCLSGQDGLAAALEGAEIVVLLLPLTPATEGVLDAAALARLAPGAVVINPGRGGLVDDAALLAALDEGRVDHATLDAFRTEPLPVDDPYWTHPRVTVTPHIASETRPVTASRVIVENIRRAEAGEPLLHLVDRDAGY